MRILQFCAKPILSEIIDFVEFFLRYFPGKSGYLLRWCYYKLRLRYLGRKVRFFPGVRIVGHRYVSIGEGSTIAYGCTLVAGPIDKHAGGAEYREKHNGNFAQEPGTIVIGKQVYLSKNCYLIGNGGIDIGDDCILTPNTVLLSMTNHYASFQKPSDRSVGGAHEIPRRQCYTIGPIVLGKNCFIALNSVVLPGVTILEDSCVLMNSVVSSARVGPNEVVAGNRAVFVKKRYADETRP